MKRIAIFALAFIALYSTPSHACEFCALHNGLGQYNNQADFVSLTYRMTTASTIVTGGTVEASTGDKLTINTAQFYYQHSISDEFKVQAVLPYIQKTSSTNGETNDTSSGIGDAILMARYTFWGDPARQFAAVIVGVKLPVGAKKTGPDGLFSPDLVIGTGSADPLIGAVYSHNIGNWNYSADALYKFSGKGYDDYQFGNMFNLGLNGYYRLHDNFNVGMGLAGEIMAADKNSDGTVENTGGSVFFASPTVQYTINDFYAELSYQAPVYRNFSGTQLVVDNKVIVSVRYAF
jgi:hypothetical protein